MSHSPAALFANASWMNCWCRSSRTRHAPDGVLSQHSPTPKAKSSRALSAAGSERARYLMLRIISRRGENKSPKGHTASTAAHQSKDFGAASLVGAPISRISQRSNTSSITRPSIGCPVRMVGESGGGVIGAKRPRGHRVSPFKFGRGRAPGTPRGAAVPAGTAAGRA